VIHVYLGTLWINRTMATELRRAVLARQKRRSALACCPRRGTPARCPLRGRVGSLRSSACSGVSGSTRRGA